MSLLDPSNKRRDTLDADGEGESLFTEEVAIKILGKAEVERIKREIALEKKGKEGK